MGPDLEECEVVALPLYQSHNTWHLWAEHGMSPWSKGQDKGDRTGGITPPGTVTAVGWCCRFTYGLWTLLIFVVKNWESRNVAGSAATQSLY